MEINILIVIFVIGHDCFTMKFLSIFFFVLILGLIACCPQKEECPDYPINYQALEVNNSICSFIGVDEEESINLIISSDEDLKSKLECSESFPDIDFENHYLVASKYRSPQNSYVLNRSVYKDCEGKLVYDVKIQDDGFAMLYNLYFYVLIPREYLGQELIFKFKYLDL